MDLRSKRTTRLTDTAGDRHRAVLFAGRRAHLLRIRSRRHAADLRHGARAAGRRSASASAKAPTRRRCGRRAATSSPSPSRAAASSRIGIMKPDGSGERMLTEGFHNEGPTFAPNGRVLMFFRDRAAAAARRSLRSTSPAATSRRFRRRPSRPIRPGRRCCRERCAKAGRNGTCAAAFPPRSSRINHSKRFTRGGRVCGVSARRSSRLTERSLNERPVDLSSMPGTCEEWRHRE